MAFMLVGVLLILLKLGEIGPVAEWSWWIVLAPFAAAVSWWSYADASGLTAKRQADKVAAKAKARRDKAVEAMGGKPRR
jgi:small Trp-rich protein